MSWHVIPTKDERPHIRAATRWCKPEVRWADPTTGLPWSNGGAQIIHNAADCRELVERATQEGYGGWELWEGEV